MLNMKVNKALPEELFHQGKRFALFLEIEEENLALVQAEIDAITGMGYWFDFREFDLEAN